MIIETRVDIIVLGATGFTGKYVVRHLAEMVQEELDYSNIKFGIAGRSNKKLKELLCEIGGNSSKVYVQECDVNDRSSLREVTRRAKVLVNCTSPNTQLSWLVVEACIETGTHYIDVSAEISHIVNIYTKYNKLAEQANVLVVPGCGVMTLVSLAGLITLEKHFKGTLKSVDCYFYWGFPWRAYLFFCNNTIFNYGTWKSILFELQNYQEYMALKKTLPVLRTEPENDKTPFLKRYKGRWYFPYPGPENDVMAMTQSYLHETRGKPKYRLQFFITGSYIILCVFALMGFIISFICSFKSLRSIVQSYPRLFSFGFFSHGEPNSKVSDALKFNLTYHGKGYDSDVKKDLIVKVYGGKPYITTAVGTNCSAITILKDSSMPKGGVLPTAAAFYNTHLDDMLIKHGIKFEIIDKE